MTVPRFVPLVWLDLCSGLGGASQPALDRGWKVIRVDIDGRFKPDIVADVRSLPLKPFHVDVLWASPPCQEFSKHGLPFYHDLPEPDLSICLAVKAIIRDYGPRYWIVENVRFSRKWLTAIFGQVRSCSIGHVFYGNWLLFPQTKPHKGYSRDFYHDHSPPEVRAKIPYEIGESICIAVERKHAGFVPCA